MNKHTVNIALKIKAKNGVLQAFIDQRNWSQSEFARQLGIGLQEVGRWFNMTDYPRTTEKMLKLINLVQKPAEEIFPPPLMDKDWLTGTRAKEWTVYKEVDPECFLPIHQMKALTYSIDEDTDNIGLSERIDEVLHKLRPIEEEVIRKRFGIGEEIQSLLDIGISLGLSRESIRRIEANALRQLRNRPSLRRKIVEYY